MAKEVSEERFFDVLRDSLSNYLGYEEAKKRFPTFYLISAPHNIDVKEIHGKMAGELKKELEVMQEILGEMDIGILEQKVFVQVDKFSPVTNSSPMPDYNARTYIKQKVRNTIRKIPELFPALA